MSRKTSVELGNEIAGFINHQVTAGRYGSASEVIRAGILLLQDQETKKEALRLALKEGEESGPSIPFEMDSFIQSLKSKK